MKINLQAIQCVSAAAFMLGPTSLALAQNQLSNPPASSFAAPAQQTIAATQESYTVRANPLIGGGGGNVFFESSSSSGNINSAIIHSGALDDKAVATMEEDLSIMTLLLQRKVEAVSPNSGLSYRMGIPLTLNTSKSGGGASYLEGYGVVFNLQVNMPLLPTPKEEAQPEEKAPSNDWENARRELYGRRVITSKNRSSPNSVLEPATDPFAAGEARSEYRISKVVSRNPYDAEKLDALKRDLIETLKNAGNIRALKPTDYVTIVLLGESPDPSGTHVRTIISQFGNTVEAFESSLPPSPGNGNRRSVMTLRAKKSDIDAFAKSSLSTPEFEKKVAVQTYRSGDAGSGTPKWISGPQKR